MNPAMRVAAVLRRRRRLRSSTPPFAATRLGPGPIIGPTSPGLEGERGANINGPSVIRVPDWVKPRLGVYYLYFAHHRGTEIRLAYSDRLEGPWTVHPQGVLHLAATAARDHIASPDVHVDQGRRLMRMYFHGCDERSPARQVSFLADSSDGLHFEAATQALAPFYLRVFEHDGRHYGIAKLGNASGVLLRSADGTKPFELGRRIIPRMRHAAVLHDRNTAWLFYSRIGDVPERLLCARLDLQGNWKDWKARDETVILEPELPYEGADEPMRASEPGAAVGRRRELRDPAILVDQGNLFMFYAIAGEQGIALAGLASPDRMESRGRAGRPSASRSL